MRVILVVAALLLMMAAAASSLPNTCRGASCRGRKGDSSAAARRPAGKRPAGNRPNPLPASSPTTSKLSAQSARTPTPPAENPGPAPARRTVPSSNSRLRPQAARRPLRPSTSSTTSATTTDGEEGVTEAVTEEIREVGVNGWLAAPTEAPATPLEARTQPTPKPAKPGRCESPKGFGIKCMSRLDQCTYDSECPGATKCCMVGECGYLCVKPKPTSTDIKQPTKATGAKSKVTEKTTVRSIERVDIVDEPAEEETQEASIQSREGVNERVKEESEGTREEESGNKGSKSKGEGEGDSVGTSTSRGSTSTPATSDVTTEAEATLQSPALV